VLHGGAKFSIVNSNYTNNVAVVGGAIYAYDGVRVSISDHTIFRGNRAFRAGGSITVYVSSNQAVNLVRCLFVFRMEEE